MEGLGCELHTFWRIVMLRRLRYLTQKIKHAFKKRSLQFTISITFTLVAVTGMILVAVILSARFVNSNEQMISDDNRRMLNQVNLNLDNYLHNICLLYTSRCV